MATRKSTFLLEDRTSTINKLENEYGLMNQLGIFGSTGVTTRTFQYDQYEDGFGLIEDREWGSPRNQYVGKEKIRTYAFPIPHFPFDGKVVPSDVQSRRMPNTDQDFDTMDAAVARELARLRRSWEQTKEWALRTAIVSGTVYSPNNTVSVDYFADLGVTRLVVNYELNQATTSPQEKGESVVAHIQDELQDGTLVEDIVAFCSPQFFSSLIRHPEYEEAYKYYAGNNGNGDPLRDRLSTINGIFRTFRGGDGIMYIEYRGSVKGTQLIPANDAYAIPMDAAQEIFQVMYAPADHMDYVNTEGQEMYAFVYEDERGKGVEIETESNFAPFCFKPQVMVRMTAQ